MSQCTGQLPQNGAEPLNVSVLWEFTAVQQTFISCLHRASSPRQTWAFLQGLAFPLLPTEPPPAARCPSRALVGWVPPPWPHPESLQVQAETCGSLGIPAGRGGWACVHRWSFTAPPALSPAETFAWESEGCFLSSGASWGPGNRYGSQQPSHFLVWVCFSLITDFLSLSPLFSLIEKPLKIIFLS